MYKSLIKKNKRPFEQHIWQKLGTPWKAESCWILELIQCLKNLDVHRKNDIPASEWIRHFSNLLNKSLIVSPIDKKHISDCMNNMGFDIFNELNYLMSEKEILCAALQLKRNKAAGTDGIINETIKSGIFVLSKLLWKLFNCIFSNSHYPITRRINTLSPLHKKVIPKYVIISVV